MKDSLRHWPEYQSAMAWADNSPDGKVRSICVCPKTFRVIRSETDARDIKNIGSDTAPASAPMVYAGVLSIGGGTENIGEGFIE